MKKLDELLRGALETDIKYRIKKIARQIEPQSSSGSKTQPLMVRYLYKIKVSWGFQNDFFLFVFVKMSRE